MLKFPTYVAADSGASFLDDKFNAINVVATAAVFVEFPYIKPKKVIYEIGPYPLERNGLLRELRIALRLAKEVKPSAVHIDSTLGGIKASELTKEKISKLKISEKGKEILSSIADDIRSLGLRFETEAGCSAYMIGKESLIVRIAELSAGAVAVSYAISEAIYRNKPILLGLPRRSSVVIKKGDNIYSEEILINAEEEFSVELRSLIYYERKIIGIDPDVRLAKSNVLIKEFPNPNVNGFNILLITKK